MHVTLSVEGDDSMSMRQVPFEALKRAAKDRKGSIDEVTSIVKMLEGQNTANMTAAEQLKVLNKMTLRLQHLKSRVSTSGNSYHAESSLRNSADLLFLKCSWMRTTKKRRLMQSGVKREFSIFRNWGLQPRMK